MKTTLQLHDTCVWCIYEEPHKKLQLQWIPGDVSKAVERCVCVCETERETGASFHLITTAFYCNFTASSLCLHARRIVPE
jgi:citrate lyase synthetase